MSVSVEIKAKKILSRLENFYFLKEFPRGYAKYRESITGNLLGVYKNCQKSYDGAIFITEKGMVWSDEADKIQNAFFSEILEIECSEKGHTSPHIIMTFSNNQKKVLPVSNLPKNNPRCQDVFEFYRFLQRVASDESQYFNKGVEYK